MEKLIIGIDPGVNTGIAILNPENKRFTLLTKPFLEAINYIKILIEINPCTEFVFYIEDPTQNKPVFSHFRIPLEYKQVGDKINYIGKIAQNIGSNKRDAQLWFEFCESLGIEYYRIRPSGRSGTKAPIKYFEKITKYTGRSSQHSRDAAMLVVGRK